jgi:hypothetical protein
MSEIKVGKPDVKMDTPTHGLGDRQGNKKKSYKKMHGHLDDDRSSARRSTGILATTKNTQIPGSPNISPP